MTRQQTSPEPESPLEKTLLAALTEPFTAEELSQARSQIASEGPAKWLQPGHALVFVNRADRKTSQA